jgi:hypothetical protein
MKTIGKCREKQYGEHRILALWQAPLFSFLSSEVQAFGMKESQALRSPKPQPDGASSGNRCSFVQHFC